MSLRLTSSALALMVFAAPAFADVTPEEVWQSWVDYYKATGYTVTEGSHDLAGETLTIKDVKLSMASQTDDKVDMTVPQVTLTATGDGKVRTVHSDTMTIQFSGKSADDKPYTGELDVSMPGNEIVSSGTKEDLTHDLNFPTVEASLKNLKSADESAPPMNLKVGATNTTGQIHLTSGTSPAYDYTTKSEKVSLEADGGEGESKGSGKLSFNNVESTGKMSGLSSDTNMQKDLAAAMDKGLNMNGTVKAGEGAFDFAGNEPANAEADIPAKEFKGNGTFAGFDLTFGMSKDGLVYQGNSDKMTTELTSSDLPFPITYGIEGAAFDLQLPVSKGDQPQPFKVTYSLDKLTLGDDIWNLFDPTKQLPRDPASLDIDVTGNVKVLQSIFDPAFLKEAEAAGETDATAGADATDDAATADATPPSPYEALDVTINQIALSAVGTSVSANGSLKPSETAGMTAPVGKISARYEGVNGLIDKLAAMGYIPQDQLAGVRMMLAMFARPADGKDVLTTDLEFKDDGAIFANGQQVK